MICRITRKSTSKAGNRRIQAILSTNVKYDYNALGHSEQRYAQSPVRRITLSVFSLSHVLFSFSRRTPQRNLLDVKRLLEMT